MRWPGHKHKHGHQQEQEKHKELPHEDLPDMSTLNCDNEQDSENKKKFWVLSVSSHHLLRGVSSYFHISF